MGQDSTLVQCEARAWLTRQLGPIRSISRAAGATDQQVLWVACQDGKKFVVRLWTRPGWRVRDAGFSPKREASALASLAHTAVRTPELVAYDDTGDEAGIPALVMSVVEGEARPSGALGRPDMRALTDAIGIYSELGVDVPDYEPYNAQLIGVPPRNALRPQVWEAAAEVIREFASPEPGAFIHRDLHPGNLLWYGATPPGILDWMKASRGEVELDIAHMRWNLVAAGASAAANGLRFAFERSFGRAYDTVWDCRVILDLLPYPLGSMPPVVVQRLEDLLMLAVRESPSS
jgi:aminoglycoside phosphotransferase (APT) family kinase protein